MKANFKEFANNLSLRMELKQVILVRTDLKMGKGKIAAQVAHASLGAALKAMKIHKEWFEKWIESGQAKIVLRVSSESELLEYRNKAVEVNLPTELIIDRGLTQLEPGTITCLAIGPAPSELIDKLTGSLKLL